jgi:NUMOD3 motif
MNFCTYLWLREDGTPYYAGKGLKYRPFRKGSPPKERVIVQEWLCEEDALLAEKFLIALYGRKDTGEGILINLTDGGEGTSGGRWQCPPFSEEHRRKIGNAHIGMKRSAEACRNISEGRKGKSPKTLTAEHRRKIGEAQVGKIIPIEARLKMSAAKKGKLIPHLQGPKSEGARKNMSLAAIRRWQKRDSHGF